MLVGPGRTSSAPASSARRSGWPPRRAGLEVWLTDVNHEHVRTASGLGAGVPAPAEGAAQLTVVAVPPDHIAESVVEALERGGCRHRRRQREGPAARRSRPTASSEAQLARYVGSHPMAGSERSGPLAATAALFDGRPWAITPHVHSSPEAVALVEALARLCRRGAGAALAGGARPRGGAHLAPAAPARRAHRRPARRRPARAPLALGPGRARRHPDRGRRPRPVGPDHPGQPGGRRPRSCATCRATSTG